MMIHDKLMAGQFLWDVKNEHNDILQGNTHRRPIPALNMDVYSAYAYQQHLQQQQQRLIGPAPEVLDLSRRCDSVETPRKTPSPYHTNSSGAGSPTAQSPTRVPPLYVAPNQAAPATQQLQTGLSALYPSLYFPCNIEQELSGTNAVTTQPIAKNLTTISAISSALPAVRTASLLQNIASAEAVVTSLQSPDSSKSQHNTTLPTTPKSSTNADATVLTNSSIDLKTTRPFKAFPRDPLVIAANFAATDVLLDNPRVERYTEYRKRVLEQIRSANGGTRTVTNPKMRRTTFKSGSIPAVNNNYSENEERSVMEESSDCDSNAGNFESMPASMTSSISSNDSNENNNSRITVTTTSENNCSSANANSMGLIKDSAYYERRRKNNAAAKKSRDRRRIKEDEIAIRAAYLERQNIELLCQIDALKTQLAAFTSKITV